MQFVTLKSRLLNRRHAVTGIVAGLSGVVAAPREAAAFGSTPTALGRAFLALVKERNPIVAQRGSLDDETQAEEIEILDGKSDQLWSQMQQIAAQIASRPIRSVSDIVDRAIVAASDCDQWVDGSWRTSEGSKATASMISGVLGLASIDPTEAMS